jgi:hypothetical protein
MRFNLIVLLAIFLLSCSKDDEGTSDPELAIFSISHTQVRAGDHVMITGQGFVDPVVTMGGASVTVLDTTFYQMLVEIPEDASDGPLIVQSGEQEARSLEVTFLYRLIEGLENNQLLEIAGYGPNNRAIGYEFRSDVDGFITEIGGMFPVNNEDDQIVRIYSTELSTVLLATYRLTAGNQIAPQATYMSISPLPIEAGKNYLISVAFDGVGVYYSLDQEKTFRNLSMLQAYRANDLNTLPSEETTSFVFVDIGFMEERSHQ